MAKKSPATPAKKPPAKRKPRPKKSPEEAKVAYADAIADLVKAVDLYNEVSEKTGSAFRKRLNAVTGDVETYLLDPPKPVVPAIDPMDDGGPLVLRSWLATALKAAALLVLGSLGGWWAAGSIDVSPGPGPSVNDCLTVAHAADRVTQIAVLKDLASQPFDGATDDGRKKAGEWFNTQRFRKRADDFGAYTDAVSEAIAANTEAELAKKLEGK